MINSTVNFSTSETSTNSSTHSFGLIDYLEISVYTISLFSLPIHCYILWLIIKGIGSGVVSEFVFLNLCVCEICICLGSLVFILSRWFSCFVMLDFFVLGLTFTTRPLFQCLMCVERYLAVVHPVTFLKYKPLSYRVICCTAIWIISLGSCLTCMFNASSENSRGNAWFLSVQLTLVISIQLFCLVAVLRALKQSGPGERKREEENHMKRRAFHLILITTVTMIVLFFPYAVTGIAIIVTNNSSPMVWFTSVTCFILAGFVQPFLYLRRARKLSCLCSS